MSDTIDDTGLIPSDPQTVTDGSPPEDVPYSLTVEGFRNVRPIRQRGQGIIWLADQDDPPRPAILKTPRPGYLWSQEALDQFKNEVRLSADLEHPNIAPIYDAGEGLLRDLVSRESQTVPFFSMRYLKGVDLVSYVQQKRLDRRQIVALVCTLAEAIQYAHHKAIIHCDIKPENILVTTSQAVAEGESPAGPSPEGPDIPFILDFGLAIGPPRQGADLVEVVQHKPPGTVPFMSPEQAHGGVFLDNSTDVYSLGVTLFLLLTKQYPLAGMEKLIENKEVQKARELVATTPARRLRDVCKEMPRELDAVLAKALSHDRADRYPEAGQFARDLRNYLGRRPLTTHRPSIPYRFRLWAWRNAKWVAPAVAAGVVMVAVAGVFASKTAQAREESRQSVYFDRVHLAQIRYESGDLAETRRLLDECPTDLRAWEWHHLRYILDQSQRTIAADATGVFQACPSPDGGTILSCGKDGTLKLWDTRTGRRLHVFVGHQGPVRAVAFSPNGELAVSGGNDGTVRVWSVRARQALWASPAGPVVEAVAFNPDGSRVASAARDGAVTVRHAADGAIAGGPYLDHPGHHALCVAFSPDGTLLASGGTDGPIVLRDTRTGLMAQPLRAHEGGVYCLAFRHDGAKLVSAGEDQTVRLWDVAARAELKALRGHGQIATFAAFSPDGRRVASAGWDRAIRLWDAETGKPQAVLRGHEGYVSSVAFVAGTPWLASAALDGTVRLWDPSQRRPFDGLAHRRTARLVARFTPDGRAVVLAGPLGAELIDAVDGRELRRMPPGIQDANSLRGAFHLAMDPNGARLATAGQDGHVRLWALPGGTLIRDMPGHVGQVLCVAISPRGRWLASGGDDANAWVRDGRGGAGSAGRLLKLPGSVCAVEFDPTGRTLAVACWDGVIRLYNASTGELLTALTGHAQAVQGLAFSPDGQCLASAGSDRTVRLWAMPGGAPLAVLSDHPRAVTTVAFSPDGRRLASADDEGTILIRDTLTHTQAIALSPDKTAVWSVCFSPDGRALLAACQNGWVYRWNSQGP